MPKTTMERRLYMLSSSLDMLFHSGRKTMKLGKNYSLIKTEFYGLKP